MDTDKINTLKDEDNPLNQSLALNKIVMDLLKERKKQMQHDKIAFVIVCVVFVFTLCGVLVSNYIERQDLLQQLENTRIDFMEYMDSLEFQSTTTESTETTVEQQSDEGGGNNIFQAGENATYMEGNGGE